MTQLCGQEMLKITEAMKDILSENRERLIELDSAIGDGDLGIYAALGMEKAWETVRGKTELLPADILRSIGKAYFTEAPSTMGTLLSSAFMQAGKALQGKECLECKDLVSVYDAFAKAIGLRGGAKLGEKTILDVLVPARNAAEEACSRGEDLIGVAQAAFEAARDGMETSRQLKAVHGRPAYFGDKTVGMYDGGTVVGVLLCKAIWQALTA